jgi:hypothetical protein
MKATVMPQFSSTYSSSRLRNSLSIKLFSTLTDERSQSVMHLLSTITADTSKLSIRPSLDDIERISRGEAAKRRGIGSRQVPHRLNSMERKEWALAKVRRFVMLRGTGYRKERGDSPLANIYRNYCDAVAVPYISNIRSLGIDSIDQVIIDFSPLRTFKGLNQLIEECQIRATSFDSCLKIEDYSDIFKIIRSQETQRLVDLNINIEDHSIESMKVYTDQAIWNVPSFGLIASFSKRSDGHKYAQCMACMLANGEQRVHRKYRDRSDDKLEEDSFLT